MTTLETLDEVEEHLPTLVEKTGLDPATLKENLEALGIVSYGQRKYRQRLPLARRLIEARDPDDVPLLALALTLKVPIWTNDRDFEVAGVETYTTAQLLAKLGIRGR